MSNRSQTELPFQVVTQKRTSGQARKGSNRDKPPVPRPPSQQYSTEDTNSTNFAATSTGGGGNRKRHSRDGPGGGRHSSGRPGGNVAVQMRPKEGAESERGERDRGGEDGETRRGHTNRHSWDSETATRQLHRTTADRLERSQSARFDRAVTTTDTNNRFERLNPDTEAPGDAPRTGGTRSRKHNSRSASGSSYRSRSPKRKSGGKDQKSNHPPERGHKETTQTTNCELEWDSFATPTTLCQQQQQDGDDVHVAHNGAESQSPPVSTSPAAAAACDSKRTAKRTPEQTTVDKVSGASAQGGGSEVGERVQGTHDGDPAASGPTGDELGEKGGCSSDTETTTRLSYTRSELLGMRSLSLSQKKPETLNGKFFRGGKWCADAWLASSTLTSDEKGELEESEVGETVTPMGKNLPKLKNPSTLSIIREHDAKTYGKVCLSPQRRSFGGGCSWKDASSSTNTTAVAGGGGGGKDGQTTPSASNGRDPHFEGSSDSRRPSGSRSGFQSHSHTNYAPRVINHAPLRDQKGWKGEGGRGGDRERGKSGWYKGREIEEEPEWMAFGPSDRSEVIELVGFEEHEKGREVVLRVEEEEEATVVEEVEGEGGSEGGRGAVSEEEGSTKTSEGSVGVEEGVVGVVRPVMTGEEGRGKGEKAVKEPENEFMLDGFDFSTSVSICQALASDEEEEGEGEGERGGVRGGGHLPRTVSDPRELSSALMKALRVGEQQEEEAYCGGSHPVNALTLEEVHERENIYHTQSPSASDPDQSAFNRLVAVLQSSGAIQDEPTQPPLPQKLPRPPVPLAMPHKLHNHNIMPGRVTGTGGRGMEHGGLGGGGRAVAGSFGFMLEKEMRFDEDRLSRMPAYQHNSMTQTRDPHMARMEAMRESYGTHTKSLFPSPHPHSSHPHQAPPLTSHPHEKWVERSWIHPENASVDYSGLQRSSVDPLALPVMHHHHQSGRSASLSNRPLPNSWAIEIEQRRRVELQSMRERLEPSLHPRHTSSKPNISLLPTAVMRQLHNSNPNHSLSDVTSRASQSTSADRLDQGGFGYPDMVGGVTHSRGEYPYPVAAHMRVPLRPQQHRAGVGMYTPPPQYIPIPHGMPSQQNPYLH